MKQIIIHYQNPLKVMFNEDIAKEIIHSARYDRAQSIGMHWTPVYKQEEYDTANDLDMLEKIFSRFNDEEDRNPLATKPGQALLQKLGVKHTSMSVGDIVQIDDRYYLCCGQGWEKVHEKVVTL